MLLLVFLLTKHKALLVQTSRQLLCLVALLRGAFIRNAQCVPPRYAVHFAAHAGITGTAFRVDLTRQADAVFLCFGRLDSTQHTALRQDPRWVAVVSALQAPGVSAAERTGTLHRVVALQQQYTVYRWDSLRVTRAGCPALVQALDSVYRSPAAQLERAAANRGRIVLDGTLVHVVVQTGPEIEKNLYVHSPSAASHPQLYHLLHAALELYRQQRPAALLDQRYTNG
jgi:hypothetical protein